NCGNISAAVAPFGLEAGMVVAKGDVTEVRIYNTNTRKLILATLPTPDGVFSAEGDFSMPGVPGTGARIELEYMNPGGASTGSLLPTGNPVDTISVDGMPLEVSIVDAGAPVVFVRLSDAGVRREESLAELEASEDRLVSLERIRAKAAV